MMNTLEDIDILEKYGFQINLKTNLFEKEDKNTLNGEIEYFIFKDNYYCIEKHGVYPDGDGGYYSDYTKELSKINENIEDFLKRYYKENEYRY